MFVLGSGSSFIKHMLYTDIRSVYITLKPRVVTLIP